MSEVSIKQNNQRSDRLPSSVRSLLDALRSQVKRYAVLSGLLFVASLAIGAFWLTSGIDAGWFALQHLELPVGIRSITLLAIIFGGCWFLFFDVMRPLFRRTRDTELAKLLERKFPDFQDGLMTTVEGAEGYPDSGPLVNSMLERTAMQAERVARTVAVEDVFNLGPLRKRGWIAGILALSLAGSAVARPGSLQRWWSAFVLCEQTYHLRTTAVEATIIAQPGDRRLQFQDVEGEQVYLHPRGADLELELLVPEGQSESGVPWIVPERVRVDVIRADGSRSRSYISSASGRTFRFILTRLQETVQLEVLAGDYRTPSPWRIESVTPPAIDTMHVECSYPEYTGWNSTAETVLPVLGSEVSLPIGTEFHLQVDSNKPLQSVRIVADAFEIVGDRSGSALNPRESYTGQLTASRPLLTEDGRTINVRFQLVHTGTENDVLSEPTPHELHSTESESSLPILSNTSLKFFLHDEDDIISNTPDSLRIRGIADKAPIVAVRTIGVSNSVTRRARIPFAGLIQDDYGVVTAGFQFLVDDRTDWSPRSFENRFAAGLEYDLEGQGGPGSEFFSVQRGDLTEGQTLAVSIVATDNCSIPEASTTRSEPVVFRIVSNEELLSLLYTREMSLRRRFEEVVQQLVDVHTDLQFHVDVAKRLESGAEPTSTESPSEDRIAVTTCATRTGNQLRRQTNELESIVEGFEEIIQELINNAIPPRQLAEKMRLDIVTPLRTVTDEQLVKADRSVSRFRVAAIAGEKSAELIQLASQDVSDVIAELRVILESVRDMAELHEVLSDLKNILEEHQRVMEETKREQIRRLGF